MTFYFVEFNVMLWEPLFFEIPRYNPYVILYSYYIVIIKCVGFETDFIINSIHSFQTIYLEIFCAYYTYVFTQNILSYQIIYVIIRKTKDTCSRVGWIIIINLLCMIYIYFWWKWGRNYIQFICIIQNAFIWHNN